MSTVQAFFALVLAISLATGAATVAASHSLLPASAVQAFLILLIFSPAIVALGLTGRQQGRAGIVALMGRLAAWRVGARWYLAALLLPTVINGGALLANRAAGGATPSLPGGLSPEQQLVPLAVMPVYFLLPSLAEELGWRGYALPRLQTRRSALAASLAIGVVWALWHLPLWFVPGSTQGEIPFGWYTVATVAMAVIFTWLFNSTGGSLLPVTLLHASVQVTNVLLPVLPSTGSAVIYKLSAVATTLLAVALVAVTGPGTLTADRRPPRAPKVERSRQPHPPNVATTDLGLPSSTTPDTHDPASEQAATQPAGGLHVGACRSPAG